MRAIASLNSLVSVEALIYGKHVLTDDITNPCYAVSAKSLEEIKEFNRLPFFHYLAHCQWHVNEIENGTFWEKLKTKERTKLHEIRME